MDMWNNEILIKCGYVPAMWQLKAQKVIANAKDEAVRMKAHANEECEKLIADAHAQAERVCDRFIELKFTEIVSKSHSCK